MCVCVRIPAHRALTCVFCGNIKLSICITKIMFIFCVLECCIFRLGASLGACLARYDVVRCSKCRYCENVISIRVHNELGIYGSVVVCVCCG